MNKFIFKSYHFEPANNTAIFSYGFQTGADFSETVVFGSAGNFDPDRLDRALFLSFILIGLSYYKLFPSAQVELRVGQLDAWQVDFFDRVYQEGLSQFAYQNQLTRSDLAHFEVQGEPRPAPDAYRGQGLIALQSGGKDSLLTAISLKANATAFTPWYISSSLHHPGVLDDLGSPLRQVRRQLDRRGLGEAQVAGGLNGHVPVTYIVYALAVVDAILTGATDVLVSIGHEGEEPHAWIGDLPVNHQWAKTWAAETAMSDYVNRYIAPGLRLGSPLRGYSELKIVELFVSRAWPTLGHRFSSCNVANYQQGSDNRELSWCGRCPKCASSFLMLAAFLPSSELTSLFGGQDLFARTDLIETFKGLLGLDGVIKPFECVGEVDELRLAYQMAQASGGYATLPLLVPNSDFDYQAAYPAQDWARQLLVS